ncbi:MAG: PilZ domain-containing protein [Acidobacteriota bacterium]|nr:PilZ domain-containing protein [Acidobacteriota bacterium]
METYTRQRKIQRVTLKQPVPAVTHGERAYVVDASVHGVRLSHQGLFSQGTKHDVEFEWDGKPIRFVGAVRWTRAEREASRSVYQSGIEIADIRTDSESALRGLVEHCVERALDEQKANARGVPPLAGSFVQSHQGQLYTRHEFVHGVWRKMTTTDSRQPHSGFTVPSTESRPQVEMLRAAYEVADASMRQVIRRLAEISIDDNSPSRRYTP